MHRHSIALAVALAWTTPVGSASRVMLTADLDLFVRVDGQESSDCLTPETACSVRRAVARASALDYGGRTVSIRAIDEGAPAKYTGKVGVPSQVGGGSLNFFGAPWPNVTTFDGGGEDCFTLYDVGTTWVWFSNLRLTTTGGSGAINVAYNSTAVIGPGVDFGPTPNAHVYVHDGNAKALFLNAEYTVSGDAGYHIFNNGGQVFHEYATVTCGAPRCTFYAFVSVMMNGKLQTTGSRFVGSFKGMPYLLYLGGTINTMNAPLPYFPGDVPGVIVADQYR
jgi:hypothetical protein